MRYFVLIFAVCVLAVIGIAGRRGSHFRKPPLYIFPDMRQQLKLLPQKPDDFFSNGMASQLPPAGTVARSKPLLVGDRMVYPYEDSPVWTGQESGKTNFVETNPFPITPQLLEQIPHRTPALRVKSDGRLVEEQHLGRMDEAARDLQPPAHPARIGLHEIVGALGQAHHVDQVLRPLTPHAPAEIVEAAVDVDVLPSGEVEVGGQRLRNHADRFAHAHRVARDVEAGDESMPRGGHDQRRQHPAKRSLARAVRSEQAEQFAAPHLETHVVDGGKLAEAFSEFARLYCC